jgi:hypothetical protein
MHSGPVDSACSKAPQNGRFLQIEIPVTPRHTLGTGKMDTAWNLACKALSIFPDRITLFLGLLLGLALLLCTVIWAGVQLGWWGHMACMALAGLPLLLRPVVDRTFVPGIIQVK